MRERRHALNMSQKELGKALGITFQKSKNMKWAQTASARRGCLTFAKP